MAGESGTEARALEAEALAARLEKTPHAFDFFQAVRWLENLRSDLPRIGHARRPGEEPVRFCQEASMAFAPRTIGGYRSEPGAPAPRMWVNFMGLLGPNGPLPLHLTDYVRGRVLDHDRAMTRFLDMFHHRMIAMFYRAWATNQQTVNFERGEGDRFAMYIGSLFGIGMPSFRDRDAVADVAKLHYSGHLVCQTRHPDGLCSLLEDYYGVPVNSAEFVGQMLDVPPECQCRLGESPETGSLGWTAIVGARVWECQQRFRLRFGRMGLAAYERMLPGGDSLRRLIAWVKNYLADELQWDVQLILKKEEVPPLKMGAGARLGWTTWLTSGEMDHDADDLVLRPEQAEGM
jgi:type VI secretion system protein ImpH